MPDCEYCEKNHERQPGGCHRHPGSLHPGEHSSRLLPPLHRVRKAWDWDDDERVSVSVDLLKRLIDGVV